ncbi:OR13A protein, partial [Pseudoatta argentina]
MILLQIFICSSIIAVPTIPCLLYVLFEAENIQQKLNTMMPLINRFMSSMHYWVLLKRRDDIHKLIRHMEVDWNLVQRIDEREVMLQHAKFGRFITIICGIMLQGGCLLFALRQSMKTATSIIGNETFITHLTTCPIYSKIIDTRFTPLNEISLVLQNLVILAISFCTAGGCSLAAVFAIHACGQLNVLYAWLHELVENNAKENDKAEQKLAAIVKHHLRILSFISHIEKITNVVCLVEVGGCTLHMCLLGYYCILDWNQNEKEGIVAYGIILISVTFNIFIFCYIGEILSEQCGQVGEIAYMTNWYLLPGNTALDLVLIILRSSIVVKITAGKMIELSLSTFGNVIKSALAYLNILRTLITVWPRSANASLIEKIRSDFAIFICYFLIITTMVPNGLSMFVDSQMSYETRLQSFGPLTFWFIAMVNYSCLLMHVDDIHNCVEHVKMDWLIIRRFENQKVMLKSAKLGRFIAGFCAVFMHCGVFSYNIVQGLSKSILYMENSSIVVRGLPYPFYNKILNVHFSPAYEFVFFLQCLSSFVVNCVTVATCGLTAVFVMHACGQMKIMISWLENFIDDKKEERISLRQRFAIIVNHHLRILSFVSRTEKIMNVICLVELIGCTVHICLLGYYCIMDFIDGNHQSILSHSMVLSSITFNIFIFCYIGEILSEQTEDAHAHVELADDQFTDSKSIKSITNGWNYSIQMNRWFLKPIGVWPLTLCETTVEKIGCMILTVISCLLICFLLIPCTLCTILVDTDLDTKIRMIGPVSFLLMAAVKQYILIIRSKNIDECIRHIRVDWSHVALNHEEDREIMVNNAKFGRWLSSISAIFMYSAGIFYTTVMPIFAKRTEIIDNETVRSLSFPIYRGLFDPRTTPSFEIAQFTQALAGYVIYTITISVCSLTAVFVMHACGQFRILMLKMEDLADGKERKSANSTHEGRLGDIVEHHIRILSFIDRTEKLLNEICLVDVVGCTLNICFLGFNMMTEWEHRETLGTMTFCSLLVSFTFNIFILCYIGELLAEQCIQISMKSYMINWYRIPNKGALCLTLIMAMSNATIKLTAGKFMDLSLASFCSIVKASVAYLNLLRTFYV